MIILWDEATIDQAQNLSSGKENTQEKQSVLDLVEALVAHGINIMKLDKNNSVYGTIEKAVATKLVERQDILDILKRLESHYTFDTMNSIVEDIMNLPSAGKRTL